jgi:hypothetical protein
MELLPKNLCAHLGITRCLLVAMLARAQLMVAERDSWSCSRTELLEVHRPGSNSHMKEPSHHLCHPQHRYGAVQLSKLMNDQCQIGPDNWQLYEYFCHQLCCKNSQKTMARTLQRNIASRGNVRKAQEDCVHQFTGLVCSWANVYVRVFTQRILRRSGR